MKIKKKRLSARQEILTLTKEALKKSKKDGKEKKTLLPNLSKYQYIRYQDKVATFKEIAASLGAEVSTSTNLTRTLEDFKKQYGNKLVDATNPKQKKLIKSYNTALACENGKNVVVVKSSLAVAENGAFWLERQEHEDACPLYHRSLLFFCHKFIACISKKFIVNNLYEAYQKISRTPSKKQANIVAPFSYGVFVAGPSKTADIGQHLVIGAHAAKSLHIVLY